MRLAGDLDSDGLTVCRWEPERPSRGRSRGWSRVDRSFTVPDVAAHAADAPREPTYGVRFTARELWGVDASPTEFVHVDLWQRYLARA